MKAEEILNSGTYEDTLLVSHLNRTFTLLGYGLIYR